MYKRVDLIIAVGLALLGVGIVVAAEVTIPPAASAYTFDPIGPRGFSLVIGIMTIVLGGLLVLSIVRQQRAQGILWARVAEDPNETGDDDRYPASSLQAFKIIALSIVYAILMGPLGYLISSALFISACMWAVGSKTRSMLIAFPIVYSIGTWALFGVLLNVRLPHGPLTALIKALNLD